MGQKPSRPSPKQTASLQKQKSSLFEQAAAALSEADILLVVIGESIDVSTPVCGRIPDQSVPEIFYGFWGEVFNHTRTTPVNEAYEIISRWCCLFSTSEVARGISVAVEEAEKSFNSTPLCDYPTWKQDLKSAVLGEQQGIPLVDLLSDGNDDESSDDDSLANLNFDAHAPDLPGAFHVFTTCVDGHAARLFGHHRVRECRGSIQQWQCGSPTGPCRANDVWEAPSGFMFNLESAEAAPSTTPDSCSSSTSTPRPHPPPPVGRIATPLAPAGPPLSRPPVHLVPMYHGSCMDRALSVADAFRTNFPSCRSCGRAPARPAVATSHLKRAASTTTSEKVSGLDCAWVDVDERRERYAHWRRAVKAFASTEKDRLAHALNRRGGRVLVLEVGASPSFPDAATGQSPPTAMQEGWGQTTARQESEAVVADLNRQREGCATLVRVNEVWPLADRSDMGDANVISIMATPLEGLRAIDTALTHLQRPLSDTHREGLAAI